MSWANSTRPPPAVSSLEAGGYSQENREHTARASPPPPLLQVTTQSCLTMTASAVHLAPGQASHTWRGGTVSFYQHPGKGQGPEVTRGRPRTWAFATNWERTATPGTGLLQSSHGPTQGRAS